MVLRSREQSEDVVLALVEYLPMYEETRKASSGLKSQSWPARFPSFHSYLSLRASPVSLPQHSSFRQPGDMHDDPRDPHVVRKCQVKHSFGESKRKSTSRYGRGKHSEKHHQQYPLKGVVRCRYGAGMVRYGGTVLASVESTSSLLLANLGRLFDRLGAFLEAPCSVLEPFWAVLVPS